MSFRTKTQVPNAQRRAGRGDAAAAPHVRLRPPGRGKAWAGRVRARRPPGQGWLRPEQKESRQVAYGTLLPAPGLTPTAFQRHSDFGTFNNWDLDKTSSHSCEEIPAIFKVQTYS